jgi:hypothetical protein
VAGFGLYEDDYFSILPRALKISASSTRFLLMLYSIPLRVIPCSHASRERWRILVMTPEGWYSAT